MERSINIRGTVKKMNQMNGKYLAGFVLLAFLVIAPSFAGMALSPATGTYNITRQGGVIQFVVTNMNTYDRYFIIGQSGTFEGNRFIKSFSPESKILVKANDFRTFYMTIQPDDTVEYGRKYPLAILVRDSGEKVSGASAPSGGIGATSVDSMGAGFYIIFQNKGTQINYGGFDEEATRQAQKDMQKPTNYLPLVLAILLIVVLLAGLFFFLRRRKQEDEDEIVVQKPNKPA